MLNLQSKMKCVCNQVTINLVNALLFTLTTYACWNTLSDLFIYEQNKIILGEIFSLYVYFIKKKKDTCQINSHSKWSEL